MGDMADDLFNDGIRSDLAAWAIRDYFFSQGCHHEPQQNEEGFWSCPVCGVSCDE